MTIYTDHVDQDLLRSRGWFQLDGTRQPLEEWRRRYPAGKFVLLWSHYTQGNNLTQQFRKGETIHTMAKGGRSRLNTSMVLTNDLNRSEAHRRFLYVLPVELWKQSWYCEECDDVFLEKKPEHCPHYSVCPSCYCSFNLYEEGFIEHDDFAEYCNDCVTTCDSCDEWVLRENTTNGYCEDCAIYCEWCDDYGNHFLW